MKRAWTGWHWGQPQFSKASLDRFGRECADVALDGLTFYFPALYCRSPKNQYIGKPPKHALMLFGTNTEGVARPALKIDLADELRDYINDCREDGSYAAGLTQIADEMDRISRQIRKAVAKHSSPEVP